MGIKVSTQGLRYKTLVLAYLVAGCAIPPQGAPDRVPQGHYMSYRDMVQSTVYVRTHDLNHAMCVGDWLAANIAPADLAQLDRYARGEIPASATDYDRVESDIEDRFSGTSGREMLRPYCPDKVDSFKMP